MRSRRIAVVVLTVLALFVMSAVPALANGSDELGPPTGITIASGTGIAVGGTGLASGSGTITFSVPSGATVEQVILYWEGQYTEGNSDDTAVVDGTEYEGDLVGTSYFGQFIGSGYADVWSDTYRLDITDLKLWGTFNSVNVSGIVFDYDTDGAGILAIYSDGPTPSTIDVRDGNDGAFYGYTGDRQVTVPQTFTFPAWTETRTADLALFVSSANNQWDDDTYRPNVTTITGDVTETFDNLFSDSDGDHWDSVLLHITVPAGATTMTVQVNSEDDGSGFLPSSLFWIGAGLMVPPPPPPGCTLTQGYWKNHSSGDKYDSTWDAVGGPGALFFSTGDSWIDVFNTAPKKGNAFYILAHQYMAAVLNTYAGASQPASVVSAISQAGALLSSYSGSSLIPKSDPDRATAIWLAGILDDYNTGKIGPGHCSS
jgi:hypothetical protein